LCRRATTITATITPITTATHALAAALAALAALAATTLALAAALAAAAAAAALQHYHQVDRSSSQRLSQHLGAPNLQCQQPEDHAYRLLHELFVQLESELCCRQLL
jgi:hypothetical protein